jgi:methylaspartate ammonia-lyase
MSHDVTQWLDEIKALRQQVAEAQQEREQAFVSASNWQRLYETEAQQRRAEANLARQTIAALRSEIQQIQGSLAGESETLSPTAFHAEVEKLQTTEELRQRLIEALAERDRLIQALRIEQTNHAQTRKGLTTALGDAIDMLAKKQEKEG